MADGASSGDSYFLSYSRSDERFALRFAQDVRAQGVRMWVDQLDIRPSEHWDRAIERAVRDCRGIVVILSPRSVASDNVADEISFAIDSGKSVLPVMIEKCVLPLRITRMHLIDATASYDRALQQCLAELKHPDRAGAAAGQPMQTTVPIGPEAVATAKQQLTAILGPIASILVDKAAARSGSLTDLYGQLAQHIDGERDRERFLATVSPNHAPSLPAEVAPSKQNANISGAELDSIAGALTLYLGPIAPLVAKRESRDCSSLDDLRHRLAALIPVQQDRDDFLRRVKTE
jgi:hypothetical protein